MTDQQQGFAMEYVPTLGERFWRKLGFHYRLSDLPDDIHDRLPGWMLTTSQVKFSFADRLRLLLTGRVNLQLRQATNIQVDEAYSELSFEIIPPFGRKS